MARRLLVVFVVFGAFASLGASYRTRNFVVEAATPEIARQVGEYAEHYRREKALHWLGYEMPPWPQPCPVRVTVTMRSGGATTFYFDRGRVLSQRMQIEGRLDRLLASVLPHEVTHTVFAHHFRQAVPRWADEGGSVLSEDEPERRRHDQLVRRILNTPGQAIPLRRLFTLRDYPANVMALYAEGYSVTDFLVSRSSRPAFLNFVADGMRVGWDNALRTHYRFTSIEALEQAWLQHLRSTPHGTPAQVASRPVPPSQAGTHDQVVTRQTAPPSQPLLEAPRPIYRGVAPGPEDAHAQPFHPAGRPASPWTQPMAPPPAVRLGPPQFAPVPGPGYPH